MSLIREAIRRAFYFDLDAYFMFSDRLNGKWLHEYAELRPEGLEVDFHFVQSPEDDTNLILLCQEGGYFGSSNEQIRNNLASSTARGDRCIVAKHRDQYVAMSWMATGSPLCWPSFARVPLKGHGTGLLHLSFVKSDYRGHYLQRFLDLQRKKYMFDQGLEQSFTFVGVKNLSSLKNCMACNEDFRLIFHLGLDIPIFGRRNFYPKWQREGWKSCRDHAPRWLPAVRDIPAGTPGSGGR